MPFLFVSTSIVLCFQLLWCRLVGASMIIVWGTLWSCAMFGLLKLCGKLRVTEQQELKGETLRLDIVRSVCHFCNIYIYILKGETLRLAENQTLSYDLQMASLFVMLILSI